MYIMKTIKIMAALTAAALLCTGCGEKSTPAVNAPGSDTVSDTTEFTDQPAASSQEEAMPKSISEIYEEIGQTVSLKSPQCMDGEFISNYYGIDTAVLEEYVFSMSEDAAQAETIILMKVKNTEDLEAFAECLQTIVDEKKNEMENYIPEQFAIVEKSKVQTKDPYIWLIISENADEITDVIENGLF